jgi:DNA topoisomerase-2
MSRWAADVTVCLYFKPRKCENVSFVYKRAFSLVCNPVLSFQGGRHVDNVADHIVKQLIETLKKKNKGGLQIKPHQVKTHMWVFVNCLIVNPTFDSQTKETMTLQAKNFGSKCNLSDKFIASVSV